MHKLGLAHNSKHTGSALSSSGSEVPPAISWILVFSPTFRDYPSSHCAGLQLIITRHGAKSGFVKLYKSALSPTIKQAKYKYVV